MNSPLCGPVGKICCWGWRISGELNFNWSSGLKSRDTDDEVVVGEYNASKMFCIYSVVSVMATGFILVVF